ncbi:hypothetical protein [Paraburkholderia jirisanensis]
MIYLNSLATALALCFFSALANAGEAIIFDDPSLTGYKEGNVISGMHALRSGRFSCIFLFIQKESSPTSIDKDGFSDTKIITFTPGSKSFLFENREKMFDIDGNLYRRDGDWIIKTVEGQAGCESSAGSFMSDRYSANATTYSLSHTIPAKGIRLVKAKSNFYRYNNGKYKILKQYLTKWNGVVLIKTQDDFSYVRFVDARADEKTFGRVTTGWIHSNDLVNPFPTIAKRRNKVFPRISEKSLDVSEMNKSSVRPGDSTVAR